MGSNIRFKRSRFVTKIIVAAAIVYLVIMLVNLHTSIQQVQEQLVTTQTEIDLQRQKNAQLQNDVSNGTSQDTLEDIARYRLGLVEPGEKVFYDVTN